MTSEYLHKLKTQQAKLNARIQAAEARAKQHARKQDTRRKILVGAYYLEKAQTEAEKAALKQQLDGYLKRASDRALFELPPLPVPADNKIS